MLGKIKPVLWKDVQNFQTGVLFSLARFFEPGLERMSQSKYYKGTNVPEQEMTDLIKGGFYMLHGNVCSELCVYTVNEWIGTVYLVRRLYEKMILNEILVEI